MKRPLFFRGIACAALFFAAALPVYPKSDDFNTHWPNERESGSYQAKVAATGKLLWQVNWQTTVTQAQGRSFVEIQEQGEGTPWRAKETLLWKKQFRFEENSDPSVMQVQSVTGSRWTSAGEPVSGMDYKAQPGLGKILYTDAEAGRKPQSAVLPWSPQCIPDEMLFHWVRTLPFGAALAGNETECTLVVSPRRQFRVKAFIRGTEVVTTPAGTFSCYRVDLIPQLPGPLKVLAPRMALWCRTDPPNVWVRYQGPVGGPGSPEAIIELVDFQQG